MNHSHTLITRIGFYTCLGKSEYPSTQRIMSLKVWIEFWENNNIQMHLYLAFYHFLHQRWNAYVLYAAISLK